MTWTTPDNGRKEVAEAGGGKYTTVNTGEDLRRHLEGEYTRLRLEWMDWGNTSYLDAQKQWGEKWERMSDLLLSEMSEMNFQEYGRMLDAKDYLYSKGKIKDHIGLSKKITDRWNNIVDYKDNRYRELDDLLKQERNKEQNRVKEKEKEMLDQYNR